MSFVWKSVHLNFGVVAVRDDKAKIAFVEKYTLIS